jgi:protein-S-isoprenylcysteine O-methyltransferase Ste14
MSLSPHRLIIDAWFVLLGVWLLAAITTKRAVKKQSDGSRILQTALVLVAYFLIFDPQTAVGFLGLRFLPSSAAVSWMGVAITIAGLSIAIWAHFFIGRDWSSSVTVKQDHQLIRTGPYAVVRHPIYSGLLLALLGSAIELGEVRGLIAVALATISWRLKSLIEEQFMSQQFGAEYTSYKQHVKALVPFIW